MKKIWFMIGIMLGAALAACGGAAAITPVVPLAGTSTAAAVNTQNVEKTPLPTFEPATCTVSSLQPTRTPDPFFPAPDPKTDWIQGPDGAKVTFLEYSDFQ
jgi:hypothetical protein